MNKNMAKIREKEAKWKKQASMTINVVRECLDRVMNIESSLKTLSSSLTAEIATMETLCEALKDQIEEIGK